MPIDFSYGIVLSGGGARGFSHLGVLQALNEKGIYPEIISGVSAGAIVGVFYADGYKPLEILKIFSGNKRLDYLSFALPREGIMEMTGLQKILTNNLNARKFEDLKIPLIVAATDINRGEVRYFSEGELINPIIASSSLPVLFKPVVIEDTQYLDGGIIDNVPISPLENKCKFLIGSHVNRVGYIEKINSLRTIIERAFHLSIASKVIEKAGRFDLFIDPLELKDYDVLDPTKAVEIYEIGYKETRRMLKDFLKFKKIP